MSAVPLVVANGKLYSPEILEALRERSDICFTYRAEGNLPLACLAGRRLVESEYFSFLDDDDLLLPRALVTRVTPMLRDSGIDAAVSNGYYRDEEGRHLRYEAFDVEVLSSDPLLALMEMNWLASCGGLFRSSTVGVEYFENMMPFFEWTYLAFRLARSKRVHFIAEATYEIRATPGSLSASEGYMRSTPNVLTRMLSHELPSGIRSILERRYSAALHDLSDYCRQRGEFAEAWRWHWKSMRSLYGLRYLPYTRRLFIAGR